MQLLINAIADRVANKLLLKTDVVNQIVNDASKAASMAALFSVNQKVDTVNSNLTNKADKSALVDKNQFMYAYNAADWKVLLGLENGWLFVRIVNINTGVNVYNGKVQLTSF